MWQPDGWGWRARIGVLTPHADIGPEAELRAMAPDGVSIHAARIPLGVYAAGGKMDQTIGDDPVRTFADPPHVHTRSWVSAIFATPIFRDKAAAVPPQRRAVPMRSAARGRISDRNQQSVRASLRCGWPAKTQPG